MRTSQSSKKINIHYFVYNNKQPKEIKKLSLYLSTVHLIIDG